MNEPFVRQQESFDIHNQPPQKKGCGCGTVLLAFLGCIVAIIVAIWILIMHTSLPLRFVADLIEDASTSSNLKLSGLSGSLSSGLNFKKVTWNDGEITDMRFRYSGLMDVINRDELIIYEMHIGSAVIHRDSKPDLTGETKSDPSTGATDSSSASTGSATEPPLKLLQIDRVSLNKITIKDRTTGKSIDIPKIEWTGFKAAKGAEIQFGDLVADSDHLVIKTSTPSGSIYQKRFEVTVLPKMDERILKPISADVYVGEVNDKTIYEIKALDGAVAFTTNPSGDQQIITKDANIAEFFDAPLPNKLNFESTQSKSASDETTDTVKSGSFLLGNKTFEIQPFTITLAKDSTENPNLTAIHRGGETEIRYQVPMKQKDFRPNLASTPAMSPENLMSLIYHDQEFSKLPAPDQEKIRKHLTWFTFKK